MPLAVITSHFNPAMYKHPRRNLLRFMRQMEAEGVPIYVAELAMGVQPWVLPEAKSVVRFRTEAHNVLWYKENLLNLVERIVPSEFDCLAWIDADVWFQNLSWYSETESALEQFAIVQMCERIIRTNEDGSVGWTNATAGSKGYLAGGNNHPGMAWAARRTLWTVAGGLYERAIIGGGDTVNAAAWLTDGGDLKWMGYSDLPNGIARLRKWASSEGPCGFITGNLWHEWHGDDRGRQWGARHKLLRGLDVGLHLERRLDGLLEWAREAPAEVRRAVSDYFNGRQEDGATNTTKPQLEVFAHERELRAVADLLNPDACMIHFGGCAGSLWFAGRVREVHTIEHDQQSAAQLIAVAPENVFVHWERPQWAWTKWRPAEPGQFAHYIKMAASVEREWDAAFLDGRARIDSAIALSHRIKDGGFLFFHDWFQQSRYTSRLAELQEMYELVPELCVADTPQTLAVFRRRNFR